MQFYANELFPLNSDQIITKTDSVQFKTMYHTYLYHEWLQSCAILTP